MFIYCYCDRLFNICAFLSSVASAVWLIGAKLRNSEKGTSVTALIYRVTQKESTYTELSISRIKTCNKAKLFSSNFECQRRTRIQVDIKYSMHDVIGVHVTVLEAAIWVNINCKPA